MFVAFGVTLIALQQLHDILPPVFPPVADPYNYSNGELFLMGQLHAIPWLLVTCGPSVLGLAVLTQYAHDLSGADPRVIRLMKRFSLIAIYSVGAVATMLVSTWIVVI